MWDLTLRTISYRLFTLCELFISSYTTRVLQKEPSISIYLKKIKNYPVSKLPLKCMETMEYYNFYNTFLEIYVTFTFYERVMPCI